MFTLDFRFTEQFFVALILTTLTVLTHSVGMSLVQRYFKHSHSRMKDHKPFRSYRILMTGIVAIMMATHFLEVIIWALFYVLRGLIPNAMSAMYFSIYSYTTLGASNITLSDHWRGHWRL